MKKTGSNLLQLGLGALILTKEKIESAVEQMAEKGKLGKAEARNLIDSLTRKGQEAQKDLSRGLEKLMETAMKKMRIPSQKEIDSLKAEIERLKKK